MPASKNELPVGVFDSGIGGLTVLKNLIQVLPSESFIYLGDTARVPYGNRSEETIIRYAREAFRFITGLGVKLMVIACNTVSAVATNLLRVDFDIPVIGVIDSTAQTATKKSKSGKIGVIGTRRTVATGAYQRTITMADSRCEVYSRSSPLLVPLAEEGIVDGPVVEHLLNLYLAPLIERNIDVLILGCTHYQLFIPAISNYIYSTSRSIIEIVDSSTCVAASAENFLRERNMLKTDNPGKPFYKICVTDDPENFSRVSSLFFGSRITSAIELVKL